MIDQILNQLADGLLDSSINDLKAQMARLEQVEDFHLNLLNVSKDIAQGIDEQARAQEREGQTLKNCTAELPSPVLATLARIGALYALEGLKKGKGV